MTLSPQTLMALAPLLRQALQTATAKAPNVINALQNGYDPGIMNDEFDRLYKSLTLGTTPDRYTGIDALNNLDNYYGPRVKNPTESAYDAAEAFKNMSQPEHPTGDAGYASHIGELLHDTDGSQDEEAKEAYLAWLKSHGYK